MIMGGFINAVSFTQRVQKNGPGNRTAARAHK